MAKQKSKLVCIGVGQYIEATKLEEVKAKIKKSKEKK